MRSDDLPFKMKDKYVLDRRVSGSRAMVICDGDSVVVRPESADVDEIMAAQVSDEPFVLTGWAKDGKFYADDVLVLKDDFFFDEPWFERYKVLKNDFDWNNFTKVNRPFVVTSAEEMEEVAELFEMLDDCDAMTVRGYEDLFMDERYLVELDEGGVDG